MDRVVLNPIERKEYLRRLLSLDGLENVEENVLGAYTPISLTSTPDELKPVLTERQNQLKSALAGTGITVYDPNSSSKYNPDFNRDATPGEVYTFDSFQIQQNRWFSGHLLVPSIGIGNEAEKARILNRISVMFLDSSVRISRMLPTRAIYLQYQNFVEQLEEVEEVFAFLQQFEPGMGLSKSNFGLLPVLAGFDKSGKAIDLEQAVYSEFPQLQFHYNGETPIIKLRATNPELFYELRK